MNFPKKRYPQLQVLAEEVSNVQTIEQEIASTIDDKVALDRSPHLPDFVTPSEGIPRAGVLSAAALANEYAAAIKEIEAMGEELQKAAADCEAMTAKVHEAIAYCKETAEAYRDEAKIIFARIEHAAKLAAEVRQACDDMNAKIRDKSISPQ